MKNVALTFLMCFLGMKTVFGNVGIQHHIAPRNPMSNTKASALKSLSAKKISMATATWVATTGNWDVPSNWSTGVVPDATTDVIISGLARHVTIPSNVNAEALSIVLESFSTLTVSTDASLSISNSPLDAVTLDFGVALTNHGIINIGNGGSVGRHAIAMVQSADVINTSTGSIQINNISEVAFTMNLDCEVSNAGNIDIGSTTAVNGAGFVMDNDCTLTNQSTGNIQVNNIPAGDGFYMQLSDVVNNGIIHIGNLSPILNRGISMELNSQYSNNNGATTTINRITNTASTEGVGVYMSSNSSFSNSGSLLIGNTSAVSNKGISMFFEASLTNSSSGVIEINNITNIDGLSLSDDFTSVSNSGIIRIGNNSAIKRMGIFLTSLATFNNQTTGVLHIDNVTGVGASQGVGIYINAGFTNSGQINLGTNFSLIQYGMYIQSPGTLINQSAGTIQINNVANFDGILLTGASAAVTNNGMLQIGNLLAVKNVGITLLASSNFTNNVSGTIHINNINGTTNGIGIYTGSLCTFINKGPIQIGNSSPVLNYGLYAAGGTFNNHSTGNVQINNITNFDAISGSGTGTSFINSGLINIGNLNIVKRIGISLFNSSTFQNNGGTLDINTITSTSSGQGFGIYMNSGSSFTNSANLNLGNTANVSRYGIYVLAPATFTNQSSGVISINRVNTFDGIVLENPSAILNNAGQLKIGSLAIVNRNGIFALNGGQFNNLAGGLVEVNNIPIGDGLVASGSGSSLTNQGNIHVGNIAGIYRFGILLNTGTTMSNGTTGTLTINNILSTAANEGIAFRMSGATLTNSNIIQIGNLANISRFGMVMSLSSTLTNQASGVIEVNRISTQSGMSLQSLSKVFNNGTIHIGNQNSVNAGGLLLLTGSEFNNNLGSTFTVNKIVSSIGDAVLISDANSKFINNATVNIGAIDLIGNHGVNVVMSGLFQNNVTGNVQMKNITGSAVYLDGVSSLFTNKGAVTLLP